MTKRIFRSIFLVALVVLLLSVALLSVVFYNDYAVQYRSELKSEALSMAHAINGGLAEEDYLRSLEQDKISQIRITWIGADGIVRYDNEAAPAQMAVGGSGMVIISRVWVEPSTAAAMQQRTSAGSCSTPTSRRARRQPASRSAPMFMGLLSTKRPMRRWPFSVRRRVSS